MVVMTLRTAIDGIPGFSADVVAEPIYSIAGATVGLLGMMVTSQTTLYYHDKMAPMGEQHNKGGGGVAPTMSSSVQHTAGSRVPQIGMGPADLQGHGLPPPAFAGGDHVYGRGAHITAQIVGVPLLLLASTISFCMALSTELLEFRIDGLGGYAMRSFLSSTPDIKRISLLALPVGVYTNTDQKAVAAFAAFAIVLFTVIAPIVCLLCWSIQWGWFLSLRTRSSAVDFDDSPHGLSAPWVVRAAAHITTYSYAWCALDVAWAAIASSSLEMNLVTQWIVQKQPGVGEVCMMLATSGGQPCILVVGSLQPGSWWLLGAAVLTAVSFGLTAATFGLRKRVSTRA